MNISLGFDTYIPELGHVLARLASAIARKICHKASNLTDSKLTFKLAKRIWS
jgi:hypothetical protein